MELTIKSVVSLIDYMLHILYTSKICSKQHDAYYFSPEELGF